MSGTTTLRMRCDRTDSHYAHFWDSENVTGWLCPGVGTRLALHDDVAALTSRLEAAEAERDEARRDHSAAMSAVDLNWKAIGVQKDRADRLEAENAALRAAGHALHDWIDDQNPDGTEVVCNVCFAEGYDGNGLRHADNCPLHRWRVLTNPTATEGTTGENNG